MLVRKVRLRAFAESSLDTLIEAEFLTDDGLPDLEISVYRVDTQTDAKRALLEHAAEIPLRVGRLEGVDVESIAPSPQHAPTNGRFQWLAVRHHNLVFASTVDQRAFVEKFQQGLAAKSLTEIQVARAEAKQLAKQFGQDDGAWASFLADERAKETGWV